MLPHTLLYAAGVEKSIHCYTSERCIRTPCKSHYTVCAFSLSCRFACLHIWAVYTLFNHFVCFASCTHFVVLQLCVFFVFCWVHLHRCKHCSVCCCRWLMLPLPSPLLLLPFRVWLYCKSIFFVLELKRSNSSIYMHHIACTRCRREKTYTNTFIYLQHNVVGRNERKLALIMVQIDVDWIEIARYKRLRKLLIFLSLSLSHRCWHIVKRAVVRKGDETDQKEKDLNSSISQI